jgi:hypothetical protein
MASLSASGGEPTFFWGSNDCQGLNNTDVFVFTKMTGVKKDFKDGCGTTRLSKIVIAWGSQKPQPLTGVTCHLSKNENAYALCNNRASFNLDPDG